MHHVRPVSGRPQQFSNICIAKYDCPGCEDERKVSQRDVGRSNLQLPCTKHVFACCCESCNPMCHQGRTGFDDSYQVPLWSIFSKSLWISSRYPQAHRSFASSNPSRSVGCQWSHIVIVTACARRLKCNEFSPRTW